MTRHPARKDGTQTRARTGRTIDVAVGWRWYCDQSRCGNATAIVPKAELPSDSEMRDAGWFVAEAWGDICPVCLASGVRPPVETVVVVSGVL